MTSLDVETTVEIGRHDDPDEVNHLVCCRADPLVAFCGYPGDHINLASTFLCAMCVEEANRMRPGWMQDAVRICPIDSSRCPSEAEIDQRITNLTS